MLNFYTPLKTSENLRFSDVFKAYRGGTLVKNGLNKFLICLYADITHEPFIGRTNAEQIWEESFIYFKEFSKGPQGKDNKTSGYLFILRIY